MFGDKKWKGAWQCGNCPRSQDPINGCPAWMELIEKNVQLGTERVTKECQFVLMPQMLLEAFRSTNGLRVEVSQLKADITQEVIRAQAGLFISLLGSRSFGDATQCLESIKEPYPNSIEPPRDLREGNQLERYASGRYDSPKADDRTSARRRILRHHAGEADLDKKPEPNSLG